MKFRSQTATILTFIAIMLFTLAFAPFVVGIICLEVAIALCFAHYTGRLPSPKGAPIRKGVRRVYA